MVEEGALKALEMRAVKDQHALGVDVLTRKGCQADLPPRVLAFHSEPLRQPLLEVRREEGARHAEWPFV